MLKYKAEQPDQKQKKKFQYLQLKTHLSGLLHINYIFQLLYIIIQNNTEIIIFFGEDVEGLADKMSFFIDHPEKAKEMDLNGYEFKKEMFNSETIADEHIKIYKKLIQDRKKGI
jgi:spore maturation protein CgeB